jgi:glutamate-5-semialdehyde dehydrogenase
MEKDYSLYFENAVKASRTIHRLDKQKVNSVLIDVADQVVEHSTEILQANQKDLDRMPAGDPKYDRLQLSPERLNAMAQEIRNVATLESPLAEVISADTLPNGLQLSKIRVPLGVIGVIYEARPNVTLDVFSLCFKTGNVALLKGGSDAEFSNIALMNVIQQVLKAHAINVNMVTLLPAEREATSALLNAVGFVDVLIPRGSQSLISYVRTNSKIPVIETGAGIVHTYFDISGDTNKGKNIILNAKTRRVSVCNSLDCLLIHSGRLKDLSSLIMPLADRSVQIYADEAAYAAVQGSYPEEWLHHSGPEDYGIEFLDYKMAIKTVDSLETALDHISEHSSRHSEAIIAEDEDKLNTFLTAVDAAAVYANASTAFTDGAEFGLGAEIGISTQKLHARGPMGLVELTSYKWVVRGNGQVR